MTLCNNDLPWVHSGKHLGTRINNTPENMLGQDIREKRAQYIQRNNELMREFSFACPRTKLRINQIFNSHFTGSVLWNLASKEVEMIHNTWSTSIRKMFGLDRRTHRYLIEPISRTQHVKTALMKRFVKFTDMLSKTQKQASRNTFQTIKNDCRSITGTNLRKVMVACEKPRVCDATTQHVEKLLFHPIPSSEAWRISLIDELLEIRDNHPCSINWKKNEVLDTLDYLCTT